MMHPYSLFAELLLFQRLSKVGCKVPNFSFIGALLGDDGILRLAAVISETLIVCAQVGI